MSLGNSNEAVAENRLKKAHFPAQFRDFDCRCRTEVASVQPRIPRSIPPYFPWHVFSTESAAFWKKDIAALLLLNWHPCMNGVQ